MKRTVTITDEAGMHARPASQLSKKAGTYENTIQISYQDNEANLKSVMGVMSLGIPQNAEVTLEADGDDAEEVLDTLVETMKELGLTE